MANHVRQQIREAIGTLLTGLTTTGTNVFQSRVYRIQDSELPGLVIYSKEEDSAILTIGSVKNMMRTLTVMIEATTEKLATFDDEVDTICKEIETAMGGDRTLGGLAKDSWLVSTDIEFSGDGKKPVGTASLSYTVKYITAENAPDVSL